MVEEEVGGVGGGFRGRDGSENGCLTLLDIFVACKTRPSEIWLAWAKFDSPGRILLQQILLLW